MQQFDHNPREALAKLLSYTSIESDFDLDRLELDQAYISGGYGDEVFLSQHVLRASIDGGSTVTCPIEVEQLLSQLGALFGVTTVQMSGSGRQSKLVDARSVAALIARKASNISVNDICKVLGKNHGTLSRLASRAESRSDLRTMADEFLE